MNNIEQYKDLAMSIAIHYDGEALAMSSFPDEDGCWPMPYEKTPEDYLPMAYQKIKNNLENAVEFSIYLYIDDDEELKTVIEEARLLGGEYYKLVKSLIDDAMHDPNHYESAQEIQWN
ncbi:hypothetical protein [Photobacterium carnosum]|uniref:hypothetical protein n=1 Tax=Photobacterium carnosum TaxID=2023717 RepID=UPI001E2A77AE|nr:hypothetical protein [Photobacterium carnosum]MCD9498851.1 hypothetical protein [Photobacterium carnosum]